MERQEEKVSDNELVVIRKFRFTKTNIIKILIIILIIIFIFTTYRIIDLLLARQRTNVLHEQILEMTEIEQSLSLYGEEGTTFINVNFTELMNINSDTVGWIVFNEINFPIVQGSDNSFYLQHSFDRRRNTYGSIFLDWRNNGFNDRNTIIYGHNTANSRNMFTSLINLLERSYFENGGNDIIKISTPNYNFNYQIFSVYVIETEEYYITPRFNDDEFKRFINMITNRSYRDFGIDLGLEDKILTLSTCHGGRNTTRRLVVHAKLVDSETR